VTNPKGTSMERACVCVCVCAYVRVCVYVCVSAKQGWQTMVLVEEEMNSVQKKGR